MAKPRGDTTTLIPVDPETGEPLADFTTARGPDFGTDTDASRKTQDMYWQLMGDDKAGTATVTVHYLSQGQGSAEVSCGRYPADKYDLAELVEVIRTTHAVKLHPGREGDYRIRMWIKGQRGNVGNRLETILAPEAATALPSAQAMSNVDPALVGIIREMRADTLRMQEQMTAAINAQRQGGDSFAATLERMAPVLMPLVIAWMNKPKDDPMKQLTAALALTGQIRDMREDMNALPPAEEGSPWWAGAVMKALEALPAIAQARADTVALPPPMVPGAAPATLVRQSAPATATPAAPASGTGNPSHPFYAQIASLVSVQDQSDPAEVAMYLKTNMQPGQWAMLQGFIERPTAYREIVAIHPGALDNPGFWADLQAEIQELAAPAFDAPPPAGDTAAVAQGEADGNDGGSDYPGAHPVGV